VVAAERGGALAGGRLRAGVPPALVVGVRVVGGVVGLVIRAGPVPRTGLIAGVGRVLRPRLVTGIRLVIRARLITSVSRVVRPGLVGGVGLVGGGVGLVVGAGRVRRSGRRGGVG